MAAPQRPEGPPEPITLRDVLRAIFLPPDEPEPGVMPPLPAIPVPQWLRPAAGRQEPPPGAADLLAPASVDYALPPIPPDTSAGTGRRAAFVVGTTSALAIALMAHSTLAGSQGGRGTLLLALALIAWLGVLLLEMDRGLLRRGPHIRGGISAPLPATRILTPGSTRGLLAAASILFSVLTYSLTAYNRFTAAGVITWLLSVIGWLLVAAERSPEELFDGWLQGLRAAPARLRAMIRVRLPRTPADALPLVALVVILGAAAFLRFYRLDAIPSEMTSDHVEKLLDAYTVLRGMPHVFFANNGGREAVQFYLVALASRLFGTGLTFLTLKIVSSLETLALIPLIILFCREMVDRETGFLAAALLALSWWHIVLGRLALRIALTPLVFTLLLVTLVRGIRTGSRRAWLWAGVWMGVGVYCYQALRITPLVALAAFAAAVAGPVIRALAARFQNRSDADIRREVAINALSRQALNLALSGLVALAIFVPMLRVWHDYPGQLWNRVINRTTEAERPLEGSPAAIFINNYADALRMFNVSGDVAWISAVPGRPVLDAVTGGLFLLGVTAWLVRLLLRRDPADAFILIAALIMLLPSALAIAFPIENPSTTRASGVIPIVFLLSAWPLALIQQRSRALLGHRAGHMLAAALIAVLLAGSALLNAGTVFRDYAESYRRAALNPGEVAAVVREIVGPAAPLDGVWLQGWPHWHDYRAIGLEAGDPAFRNAIVNVEELRIFLDQTPERFTARPLIFIVHPQDTEALDVLRQHFPGGEVRRYTGSLPERGDFVLFVVPSG